MTLVAMEFVCINKVYETTQSVSVIVILYGILVLEVL